MLRRKVKNRRVFIHLDQFFTRNINQVNSLLSH